VPTGGTDPAQMEGPPTIAAMRVGAFIFLTDRTIRPDQLAVELEQRGYESLWVPEHTHIPTSRRTPYPAGGDLPDEYRRTVDPFVALASAAAVTDRLRLGTGIVLVAQHHPLNLAKSVASLDLVSDGRVVVGVGVGWNEDEMEDHGVDPRRRREHAREHVLAVKTLWSDDVASFNGEFVRFGPTWSWPKPVQQPHPPVVMGGAGGPVTFRHVVEYCDGWMPIHGRRNIMSKLPALFAAAEEHGRDPATIELGVFGCPADREIIEQYAAAGFTRCVLALPPAGPDEVRRVLDHASDAVDQYIAA
jgi:probable F420-dependent oxidoreductase